jgi:hypothetical protein
MKKWIFKSNSCRISYSLYFLSLVFKFFIQKKLIKKFIKVYYTFSLRLPVKENYVRKTSGKSHHVKMFCCKL